MKCWRWWRRRLKRCRRRLKGQLAFVISALDFPTTVHVDGKFGDQEVYIKEMYRKVGG